MSSRLKNLAQILGRWGVAFFILLALDVALAYLAPGSGLRLLVALALYVSGLLFALQLIRRNMRRLIWRLRNRLIVAYLFIAFVPIALIAILVAIGGWILTGQTAVYLVSSELDRRTAALHGVAQMLAQTTPAKRQNTIREVAPYIRNRFPTVELLIHGKEVYRYPEDSTLAPPPAGWKDASGLITKDSRLCSWAHVTAGDTEVTLVAPLNSSLLAQLVPDIGEVFFGSLSVRSKSTNDPNVPRNQRGGRLPAAANVFDVDVPWAMPVNLQYWNAPGRQGELDMVVHTRPWVVLGTVFSQVNYAQGVLGVFLVVAAILLLVELVSLILGVSMTRTITGAVHNLYEGTQRVKEGDFSHRIAVEGHDQLAELGRSFNGMTENLERLIVIEKEQERLKSEIAIAREVQSQLFPRSAPEMRTLELTGVCHPARMVSGDYYDFVQLRDANVALDLVSELNRQVYANTSPEKYATFYFGLYDDENRMLTYTNAGHLPPLLMRDGAAQRLEVTGTVVGAFPFAVYEEKSIALRRGDLLVAFTDGIVEPENEYGEPFGEDRLIDLLVRYGQRESKEIIARIMETVEQWTGSSELFDDMTLLLARGV